MTVGNGSRLRDTGGVGGEGDWVDPGGGKGLEDGRGEGGPRSRPPPRVGTGVAPRRRRRQSAGDWRGTAAAPTANPTPSVLPQR